MFFKIIKNFTTNIFIIFYAEISQIIVHKIYPAFSADFSKISSNFSKKFSKILTRLSQNYLRFSFNKYYCQNFCFFYGCFTCSKNWLTISCKFFKIFLKKIKKFCYTYYISTLKFSYILFKISVVCTKNLPLFSWN